MSKIINTKTVLKFSARKIFTKIAFLSLQNVGWTGFHYSRKGEYTAASIGKMQFEGATVSAGR